MPGSGYVHLHRRITEHWTWSGKACDGRAWIDLVMMAAHAPHTAVIGGEPVKLERGELVASVRFLARRWDWGHQKTVSFLHRLETDAMLLKKQNGSGNGSPSVFLVINYDTYQTGGVAERNASRNARGTVAERLRNEDKKGEKVKKETSPAPAGGDHGLIIAEYQRLAAAANGASGPLDGAVSGKPHITARDGAIVKDLLGQHPAGEILYLLRSFFHMGGTAYARLRGDLSLAVFQGEWGKLQRLRHEGSLPPEAELLEWSASRLRA